MQCDMQIKKYLGEPAPLTWSSSAPAQETCIKKCGLGRHHWSASLVLDNRIDFLVCLVRFFLVNQTIVSTNCIKSSVIVFFFRRLSLIETCSPLARSAHEPLGLFRRLSKCAQSPASGAQQRRQPSICTRLLIFVELCHSAFKLLIFDFSL